KSGFTLIELLVVITIIAILAGLAMSVLPGVIERTRATNDAHNMRQLGLTIQQYLTDNDQTLFEAAGTGAAANPWPRLLNPLPTPPPATPSSPARQTPPGQSAP